MNNIDIGRAVKAPFADKEWLTKSLLAIVWTFLIVTFPAVLGAEIEYIKRTAEGREELPDWSDFGDKWVKGFLAALAGFIYFLPVVVIALLVFVPVGIGYASGSQSDAAGALLTGGTVLFGMFAFAYMLAVTLFFYAALTHYALTERFGAFFEFGEIAARIKGSKYFTAWLFAWVIAIGSSVAQSVLTATWIGGLLVPAVSYLAMMMTSHLLGQYAAQSYGIVSTATPSMVPAGYAPPATPAYQPPPPPPAYQPPVAPTAASPAYQPPPPPAAPPAEYVAPAAPTPPPAAPPAGYAPPAAPEPPAEYAPPSPEPPAMPDAPPTPPPVAPPEPPSES